jgi:hypothetical protein
MKTIKYFKLLVFAISLLIISSCGSDRKSEKSETSGSSAEDVKNGSELLCEMKAIEVELVAAYESSNEAAIETKTNELEAKSMEMNEFAQKMETKFVKNPDGFKKLQEEIIEQMNSCEHYTKEDLEHLKQSGF